MRLDREIAQIGRGERHARIRGGRGSRCSALDGRLEHEDGARHRGIERCDPPPHRDPDQKVAAATDRGRQAASLAADDEHEGAAKVRLPVREPRICICTHDPETPEMEARERAREVVNRRQEQMLARARGRLDCGRAEWRLAARREEYAVDAGGLSAPEQRAQVLRILEGVKREHEWRLTTPDRAGKDLVRGREATSLHDQRNALVAIKAGRRGQGATLDLHDRDPEGGRVEDDPLERIAALRRHEEATRGPAGNEGLLYRMPACDEFLVVRHDEGRAG